MRGLGGLWRVGLWWLCGAPLAAAPVVLDPPACELRGCTLVPAKPVCEWLGLPRQQSDPAKLTLESPAGTVALQVGRAEATVRGQQVTLRHRVLPAPGDVYLPLRDLVGWAGATRSWSVPTRTVTLRREANEISFTVLPEAYPVVRDGILIGGWRGGAWASPAAMAKSLKGGERYSVQGLAGPRTVATGAAPTVEQPGEFLHVALSPEARDGAVALAAPWLAATRPVTAQDRSQSVYQQAAAAVLAGKGLKNAPVHLTQLLRVDLEGNGTDEVLISATTAREGYPRPDIKVGDYSFVALRRVEGRQVRTLLLDGEFHRRAAEFAAPHAYEVAGVLDLDGDGQLEILVGWRYYEGAGTTVYKLTGGKLAKILEGGAGA